jgi:hypothetical protein
MDLCIHRRFQASQQLSAVFYRITAATCRDILHILVLQREDRYVISLSSYS